MNEIFDNLVKLGNKNPDLRGDISPVLRHLKTSSGERNRSVQSVDRATDVLKKALHERGIDAYVDEEEIEARKAVNSGEFGLSWKVSKDRKGWVFYIVLTNGLEQLSVQFQKNSVHEALDELMIYLDNLSGVAEKAT